MKNISNIIRCTMLLAMLAVGGNAWADYYIMGDGWLKLDSGTLTQMVSGIYSFTATNTDNDGGRWFRVYDANDQSNSHSCKMGDLATSSRLDTGTQYTISTPGDNRYEYKLRIVSGTTYTFTVSDGKLTITTSGASYTITGNGSNCSFSPSSQGIPSSSSGYFDVTPGAGYKLVSAIVSTGTCSPTNLGNATTTTRVTVSNPSAEGTLTVTTAAVTFTISAVAGANGSVSPSSQSPVAYNGSTSFTATPSTGYIVDQTNTTFSGTGNLSYGSGSPTTITISNITSEGTLSVAFKSGVDYTPVVNFGDIPKKTVNSIEVNAYVAELSCKTVTAAGFYWGTSIAEAEEHSNSRHFAASTPATIGSLVKGGTFSKDGIDLFNGGAGPITTGTNIFFQAYVTTSGGGGTGYSDVVGFFYNPCQGLSEVSLTPTAVTLAEGYSVELSVVARSAGKSPTYEWYLDKTEGQMAGTPEAIPGADKDTYTFTLNDNNSHNIRVKVTDNTCGTSSWTHDAAGTYNGIVTSAQAVISTAANCKEPEPSDINFVTGSALAAPYQSIHLSVTDNGSSSYDKFKWEVSEGGILSGTSITDAYFRAPESLTKYTITYTAINSHCTNADVSVKKTVEIKVEKPEDGCNNPGE